MNRRSHTSHIYNDKMYTFGVEGDNKENKVFRVDELTPGM